MRTAVCGALLALLVAGAPQQVRAEDWEPGVDGVCERPFEMDAGRGPRALANGTSAPFRALYGSATGDWKTAALLPFALAVSLFDGAQDVGTGAFDLLTLGYFHLSDADDLDLEPLVLMPVREERMGYRGRPLDCGEGSAG